jgi:hypothetical protein
MLKSKSEELARKLGHNNLGAAGLVVSTEIQEAHGEDTADAVSAEQLKSTKLSNMLKKFCTDDMCNADGTCLFYHAVPDGSVSYKNRQLCLVQRNQWIV